MSHFSRRMLRLELLTFLLVAKFPRQAATLLLNNDNGGDKVDYLSDLFYDVIVNLDGKDKPYVVTNVSKGERRFLQTSGGNRGDITADPDTCQVHGWRYTCALQTSIGATDNTSTALDIEFNCELDSQAGFDFRRSQGCTCSAVATPSGTGRPKQCPCSICPDGFGSNPISVDCSADEVDPFLIGTCSSLDCDFACNGTCKFDCTNSGPECAFCSNNPVAPVAPGDNSNRPGFGGGQTDTSENEGRDHEDHDDHDEQEQEGPGGVIIGNPSEPGFGGGGGANNRTDQDGNQDWDDHADHDQRNNTNDPDEGPWVGWGCNICGEGNFIGRGQGSVHIPEYLGRPYQFTCTRTQQQVDDGVIDDEFCRTELIQYTLIPCGCTTPEGEFYWEVLEGLNRTDDSDNGGDTNDEDTTTNGSIPEEQESSGTGGGEGGSGEVKGDANHTETNSTGQYGDANHTETNSTSQYYNETNTNNPQQEQQRPGGDDLGGDLGFRREEQPDANGGSNVAAVADDRAGGREDTSGAAAAALRSTTTNAGALLWGCLVVSCCSNLLLLLAL